MAGIGFELRKLLRDGSYISLLQAYGAAGIISSGPWGVSILGILAIGFMTSGGGLDLIFVSRFQVSVTYLMTVSLILTSPLQFFLTRFIADRLYENRRDLVLPNVLGAIAIVTVVSGVLASMVLVVLFDGSVAYRVLMMAGLVTLSNIWIVVVLLSALKAWRLIVLSFFGAYLLIVFAAHALRDSGVEGLLLGFVAGQALLLFVLLVRLVREYPSPRLLAFDFLRRDQVFPSLAVTGLLYNVAIWADKWIFWFNPDTSEQAIAPLRYSPIYDFPIFLAYLSIVPGMAVFLVRVETDFAEHYESFYSTIRNGGTLEEILRAKVLMVQAVRRGIYDIFKVQGMTILILLGLGGYLLEALGIPLLYRMLLNINLVAVGAQVLLMAILNVLFYFDQRRVVLGLALLFVLGNSVLTLLSQQLGPSFYGYGFAAAVILTSVVGLMSLSRVLEKLEYQTFMLQRVRC